MNREQASKYCKDMLVQYGLADWHVRLNTSVDSRFLGMCSYHDKCIILNAHHIDTHPDFEVKDTILHEIAHALCPSDNHGPKWAAKANELGCRPIPCSTIGLSPEAIDAIRSGATVKVDFEVHKEIVHVPQEIETHKPKYTITRLQDRCPICGKVAKVKREQVILSKDDEKPDQKFIIYECDHLVIKKIPKGTPFHKLVSFWWREDVKNCKHEWDKTQCVNCGQYKARDFQIKGAQFLETAFAVQKGGGIFDEMGLGKTIQALLLLMYHPELFPALYVVKSGIKYQWVKEIVRWLGPDKVAQVIESGTDILIPGLKGYIISYDILVPKTRMVKGKPVTGGLSLGKFLNSGIKSIFLDECQQIKNPDSSRTQMLRRLISQLDDEAKNKGESEVKIFPLSGTPWKNRGNEFYPVLNLLAPTKFYSYQNFLNRWVDEYEDPNTGKMKLGGIKNIPAFREYTKDIIIRREVEEVMSEMPDVNRTLFHCKMNMVEQTMYQEKETEFVRWYNNQILSGEDPFAIAREGQGNVIGMLQKMRHLVGLAKIPATMELADEFIEETDRKLTIFTHHKDVADALHYQLKHKYELDPDREEKIPVFKLVAELNSLERFEVQEEFNKCERAILIASTLASGEGINLQTCADAIMHERQWNPANEDQAAPGRFRRIGSTFSTVNVTFPTLADTVDELLASIIERKRVFFHSAMNKGEMPTWNQTDILRELVEAIVKQHNSRKRKAS